MARQTASDPGTDGCTLCGLPTPDSPHTDPEIDGRYCCRGCLEIARSLDEADGGDPADVPIETGIGRPDDSADVPNQTEAGRPGEPRDADPRSGVPDTGPSAADVEGETAFLSVDGMHCATCEAFLESVATERDGIRAAEASYPTELVKLVYDPDRLDPADLPQAVEGYGYHARLAADADPGSASAESESDGTVSRLLVGGLFGMMVMVWYLLFLYPLYLGVPRDVLLLDVTGSAGRFLLANVWVMTSVVLGYTGYPLLRGAYVSLRAARPNMDLLVSLAAVTAYVFSTLSLLLGRVEVYFDVTVVIVLAVTIGEYYERRIRRRATARLGELTSERIETARRRTGRDSGETESVPIEAVESGDRLVVRTGERVPVDGEVIEGTAAVDNSLLTGESLPVRVGPDDSVIGGALVTDGRLVVAAGPEGTNTRDRLARLLWDVQSATPGLQRLADRMASAFVPLVIALALAATGFQLLTGSAPADAVLVGLTVLVVSCPCALGIATPLAVASGTRRALDRGIAVANATAFELAREVDVVAFDKTGTLTTGDMRVSNVIAPDAGERELLRRAAALEQYAEHPVARAICERACDRATDAADGGSGPSVSEFERHPGRGVSGVVESADGTDAVRVGSAALFDEWCVPPELERRYRRANDAGSVASYVGWNGTVRGVIVAIDESRPAWAETVAALAAEGCEVVVITGDDAAAAEAFGDHDGVSRVFADVRPQAKTEVIERLKRRGTVAMVGDGSNDAPALAAADMGVAMASGTDLAADAADLIVTDGELRSVPEAFDLLAATRRRIRQNLAWGFGYNAVALPLAIAGALNPLFAAVAMAASSLLVVINSARSFD